MRNTITVTETNLACVLKRVINFKRRMEKIGEMLVVKKGKKPLSDNDVSPVEFSTLTGSVTAKLVSMVDGYSAKTLLWIEPVISKESPDYQNQITIETDDEVSFNKTEIIVFSASKAL